MKSIDCTECLIRNKTCFDTLSQEDKLILNETKIMTLYKKGQIIFHEGRKPNGIYCLESGAVKISKAGFDGKEQIVRIVIPGELLGIRAYLAQRNYQASATTLEDTKACFIERQIFDQIVFKYPCVSKFLLFNLTKLLEEAENKLTSLAQKPVRERVAETLLVLNNIFQEQNNLCENGAINLSRDDLANIVGTSTETVIRALSDLKDENLISMNNRKITIQNTEYLRKIARKDL